MTYFIGLDMGTSSVGFAVTNEEYEILNFRRKAMWGVRMFDEAQTAADRRVARANRRRLKRRNLRLKLLQDLFAQAINAKDPGFYQRLKDSFFLPEDKETEQSNTLFFDPDFNDKDYHKRYPTIYHLRHELMTDPKPHDPRLVYLAIHHILKTRGHFLFAGKFDLSGSGQYVESFNEFSQAVLGVLETPLSSEIAEAFKTIVNDKTLKKRQKTDALKELTQWKDKPALKLLELLSNRKVKIADIFGEDYKNQTPKDLSFEGAGFEDENQTNLQTLLSDDEFSLILATYKLHNQMRLDSLLQGFDSFSASKIGLYEKHKTDLRKLKTLYKKHFTHEEYKAFFSESKDKVNNYVAYSGHLRIKNKKMAVNYRCNALTFADDLRKELEKLAKKKSDDNQLNAILLEIENGLFLPRQVSKDNSLIPNQIHVAELEKILENASGYLPFLNQMGEEGFTIKGMILELAKFRIPYYVGPLNPAHRVKPEKADGSHHAWITKHTNEAIRPWNFKRVVDEEQSASDFIANLTNKCSYLIGEDVLPKDSPTYARFVLLNQLNMLSFRGDRLPVLLKRQIYDELFLSPKAKARISKKDITAFVKREHGGEVSEADISGMDLHINNVLKAEKQIEAIAPGQLTLSEKEDIVRLITVLPETNTMLYKRLESQFKDKLSQEQIQKLSKLKFSDWGNLSNKLLTGIRALGPSGIETNLLEAMWDNNLTLMELLSNAYGFMAEIEAYKEEILGELDKLDYQIVDEYPYLSPAVKRMIWQAIRVVQEIVKIQKGEPEKIFIEVAREEGKKERTSSRLEQIKQLYKEAKVIDKHLLEELGKQDENTMRRKLIYLYFTQLGKCMYTGNPINFEKLINQGESQDAYYDIDHIYPRSETKDDSLRNNLVLVERTANQGKGDSYPLASGIQNARRTYWLQLKEKGLISEEKYYRLTRTTPLSPEELESFINRQLVQTRQATKAAAEILAKFYPNTSIVFVKAGHVTDFRYNQNDFKFIKVRAMNDLHHAKDAYLNIVVGNVYDTKFTRNVLNFVSNSKKRDYNLTRMFDFDVKSREGKLAWKAGNEGSIQTVKKMMDRNNVLTSYQAVQRKRGQSGGLFDQNLLPKGKGQHPIKSTDPRLAGEEGIAKYGGYNKITGATFFVVEHTIKRKRQRSIFPLFLPWVLSNEINERTLNEYCLETLNLTEPEIIVKNLPIKSLLLVDGVPFRINGRSENRLLLALDLQAVFPKEIEPLLKLITKQDENEENEAYWEKKLSEDELINLQDLFINKLKHSPYSLVPGYESKAKKIEAEFKDFIQLNQKEKIANLIQTLNLFTRGGARIQRTIKESQEVFVVFQSITGLFENIVRISMS